MQGQHIPTSKLGNTIRPFCCFQNSTASQRRHIQASFAFSYPTRVEFCPRDHFEGDSHPCLFLNARHGIYEPFMLFLASARKQTNKQYVKQCNSLQSPMALPAVLVNSQANSLACHFVRSFSPPSLPNFQTPKLRVSAEQARTGDQFPHARFHLPSIPKLPNVPRPQRLKKRGG